MKNIVQFIMELNAYDYKEIDISNDFDYYVHINNNGKRCHISKQNKTIEKITNNSIFSSDIYKVFSVDIGNDYREQIRKKINGYWKILIVLKLDVQDNIIDYYVNFPYIENDSFVKKFMRDLFNEKI